MPAEKLSSHRGQRRSARTGVPPLGGHVETDLLVAHVTVHIAVHGGIECRELDGARRPLSVRSQRVRPGRDERILTSWNALLIKAMARAAPVLGRSASCSSRNGRWPSSA